MAGRVTFVFNGTTSVLSLIQAGKLRALGVTTVERTPLAPHMPTLSESGVQGFDRSGWYGVLAPGETPRAVVTRLNADINALINSADVRERMAALGAEPAGGTAEQFAQRLRDEIALTARAYAYGDNQYLSDSFKQIDYLVAPTFGGGYRFVDFVKIGLPLGLLTGIVTIAAVWARMNAAGAPL